MRQKFARFKEGLGVRSVILPLFVGESNEFLLVVKLFVLPGVVLVANWQVCLGLVVELDLVLCLLDGCNLLYKLWEWDLELDLKLYDSKIVRILKV